MSNESPFAAPSLCCTVTTLSGSGKGKVYPLTSPAAYTIGRAKESYFVIDEEDKRASRNHAVIRTDRDRATIDNLSQTNPTIVNGKPMQSGPLKNGDRILIGATEFRVDFPAAAKATPSGNKFKPVMIALGAVVCIILALVLFSRKTPSPKSSGSLLSTKPAVSASGTVSAPPEETSPVQDPVMPENTSQATPVSNDAGSEPSPASAAGGESADSHYRKAMFFYDAGKLSRALDEIDLTLLADSNHPYAQKWLLRITDELNEQIDTNYQNGLVNKKFMRYRQAESDFKMVVELSRDKQDERFIDAEKQLKELGGKN